MLSDIGAFACIELMTEILEANEGPAAVAGVQQLALAVPRQVIEQKDASSGLGRGRAARLRQFDGRARVSRPGTCRAKMVGV